MSVDCNSCGNSVTGYELRVMFSFYDGERVRGADYIQLSCGCEVLDHDIEVDWESEELKTTIVDNLRKFDILHFTDYGPHNQMIDAALEEMDDEE